MFFIRKKVITIHNIVIGWSEVTRKINTMAAIPNRIPEDDILARTAATIWNRGPKQYHPFVHTVDLVVRNGVE
jgi:hypothetical protein